MTEMTSVGQDRKASCADLIDSEIKAVEKYLETIGTEENPIGDPLSIEKYQTTRVLFSYGGPSSWIDIMSNENMEIIQVAFHYQDWFDGAVKLVDSGSQIWQYAEDVLQVSL